MMIENQKNLSDMTFQEKIDTHSNLESEIDSLQNKLRELSGKARKIELDLKKNNMTKTKDFKSYEQWERSDGSILKIEKDTTSHGERDFFVDGERFWTRASRTLIVELMARKAFDDVDYVKYDFETFRKYS